VKHLKIFTLKLAVLFVFSSTGLYADSMNPTCPDARLFSGKLITDICWSCIFPMRIGGFDMVSWDSPVPPGAYDGAPICVCGDPPDIEIGVPFGFWEPARIIEVVRTPYCSIALGGLRIQDGVRLAGNAVGTKHTTDDSVFYHSHVYAFPILNMLEMFMPASCDADGYLDFDLINISELNPAWNDDELSFFMQPEVTLFANPVALSACVLDAAASTAGYPMDELFWCAGTWGNMYPFTGNISSNASPPRESSLILTRATALQHRIGQARNTMGSSNLCRARIDPIIAKSMYRASMFYPIAQANSNHALGQSTFTWGEWRNIPAVGEDFLYILWRWQDCCLR
jgi:conjugal transfer pilus assembly protein TraU